MLRQSLSIFVAIIKKKEQNNDRNKFTGLIKKKLKCIYLLIIFDRKILYFK